jgi:hypothetical protein
MAENNTTQIYIKLISQDNCVHIYIYIHTTSEKPVNDQSYGVLDR